MLTLELKTSTSAELKVDLMSAELKVDLMSEVLTVE